MLRKYSPTRLIFNVGVALWAIACCSTSSHATAKVQAKEDLIAKQGDLLQFTSAGHVLGFQSNRVYLASLDHALSVEFIDSQPVAPQSDSLPKRPLAGSTLPSLNRAMYPDLWPGITLTYESAQDSIAKSTFLLQPHANPEQIALRYSVPVALTDNGELEFQLDYGRDRGSLTESAPVAWQDIDSRRVPVEVGFAISQEQIVTFQLGAYDARYPLTIDPIYQWHTFYGDSSYERGLAVAVDGSGNVYIAGESGASWNGDGDAAPRHPFSGSRDILILKLSSSGTYLWHTFYGSGYDDAGYGIAVDNSGNVYVSGYSLSTWQGDGNANARHAQNGGVVVLKLSGDGVYQWHTFYGSYADTGYGIAVDSSSNVYVVSRATQRSWLGDGDTPPLHAFAGYEDLAVLKLSSNGDYVWHTFYGTAEVVYEYGTGIALDGSGNVYVTGHSDATWQGDNNANPLHPHSGQADYVVLKLSSSGAYQWHTFYGSSGVDYADAIAVDASGNAYVTGVSINTWQGDGNADPLHPHGGSWTMAVLKLSSVGAYQWHTFYGSYGGSHGRALAVDASGNVYVTGDSGDWQRDGNQDPLHPRTGSLVVVKLASDGSYRWHTFYGSQWDYGYGIALDGDLVYVAGTSSATWLGDRYAAPLHAFGSWDSLAVLKLDAVAPILRDSVLRAEGPLAFQNRPFRYTLSLRNTNIGHPAAARVTDTLPALLNYVADSALASSGTVSYTSGAILWQGAVDASNPVTITFSGIVPSTIPAGATINNFAQVDAGGEIITLGATVTVSPDLVFMPLVTCGIPSIFGHVTYKGTSSSNVYLELRFFNGTSWSTAAATWTDAGGNYRFTGMPNLGNGQRYYVRYTNSENSNYLSLWQTRSISSLRCGDSVALGDFDIANIALLFPPSGSVVSLPYTFHWSPRTATRTDSYEWNLFDPADGDPLWWTQPPLGYVSNYAFGTLPSEFNTATPYGWFVAAYSPDGGYGESYYYRTVAFSNRGVVTPQVKLPINPKDLIEQLAPQDQERK